MLIIKCLCGAHHKKRPGVRGCSMCISARDEEVGTNMHTKDACWKDACRRKERHKKESMKKQGSECRQEQVMSTDLRNDSFHGSGSIQSSMKCLICIDAQRQI